MRLAVVILLSILALSLAQEAVVEEATEAVESEDLDLDALLDDVDALLEDPTEQEPPSTAESHDSATVDESKSEEADATTSDEGTTDAADQTQTATEEEQEATTEATSKGEEERQEPEQVGPFIDLLGPYLYSLELIDETQARIEPHYTNDALKGKKVVGLYFSADWCGPCRKFTPELVAFYEKMNNRRGHKDDFEIVWVSRCRDMQSYGQYFTHMNWLALPFEEAAGQRGQMLSNKYKVQGIPTLVLLDEIGNVITTDARNKIPQDKAGIGFPWQNPLVSLFKTVVPRSLRLMVKSQVATIKGKLLQRVKGLVGMSKAKAS